MEKEIIQSVGFRNTKEDGKITGFQLKIRLPYYRGIFLSQIRPGTLIIDGERFEKEDIIWNVHGEDYTCEQLRDNWKTHWGVTEPAILKVKKEGGLSQGYHDITYGYCFTSSYMPPIIQDHLDPDQELFLYMPEFGHHVNQRRLLNVGPAYLLEMSNVQQQILQLKDELGFTYLHIWNICATLLFVSDCTGGIHGAHSDGGQSVLCS